MAIRYNSGDPFGVPSGYDGAKTPEDGFKVPSCGILDVDRALFELFDTEIKFVVSNGDSREVTKVPVIFAAGEKGMMLKRGRALRDANNTLILPLVTIRRVSVSQSSEDMNSRGINQHQGELTIKRRLSPKDRAYQNLINKIGIRNQDNVADDAPSLETDRRIGDNSLDGDIKEGALLSPKYGNNFWEIIRIPMQQFFTAHYEVIFWTQYTSHMNQMLQRLMGSYLPTGHKMLRLETPKGYWFVAHIEDDVYAAQDNADDMSSEERLLQYKFTIRVPAYMVAAENPGEPSPVRSQLSAPIITFGNGYDEDSVRLSDGIPDNPDPADGADDPSRGFTLSGEIQPRERQTSQTSISRVRFVKNPFTGQTKTEYLRVVTRDPRTGEEILVPDQGVTLNISDE
jgi:hypothetical protein